MTRTSRITVVVACAALLAAALLAAAGPASAARKGPILSPRGGERLPARPVLLKIHTGKHPKVFRAQLNGHGIRPYFSPPSNRGVRKLRASRTYGLRHGKNRLHVLLKRRNGPKRDHVRRFRIRRNRPLAAAGFDRTGAVGAKLYLDSGGSRSHMRSAGVSASAAGRHRPHLRHSWKVVRAPKDSPPGSPLAGAETATPVFKPEAAGRYRIRVTVTARGGKKGSDVMDVAIDPPPAVTVDTHAQEGNQVGVKITTPGGLEDAFYPGDFTKWLQVVVLDRDDLSKVSNTSYDCPEATTYRKPSEASSLKRCIDRAKADLDGLKKPAEKLVIVTSPWRDPSDFGVQPPNGASQVFGAWPGWWKADQQVWRGTYSAIGPAAGCCRFTSAANDQTGPYFDSNESGDIKDLLVRDNQSRYSLSPQPLQFDTQAPGSDESHSVMEVAGKRYAEFAPYGGFHVVVVDPDTLEGKSYYFLTNTGDPRLYLGRMHDVLHDAIVAGSGPTVRRPLVFITSHGDAAPPRTPPAVNDDLARLAGDIEKLDGTRTAFLTATEDATPRSYALATSAPAASGGQENLGPEGNTAAVPMTGTIARTAPYYAFEVQQGNGLPTAKVSPARGATQLLTTVGQGVGSWPEDGNPGRTAAIKFIGKEVLKTDEPRTQFWTVRWTPGLWRPVYDDIGLLCRAKPIPDGCKSTAFTQDDLGWAKNELQREIKWMDAEHKYLDDLATPFQASVLGSWADLQAIAEEVAKKVDLHNDTVKMKTEQIVDKSWDIVEGVPLFGEAVGTVRNVYDLALIWASYGDHPLEEEFDAPVGQVGKALVDRMTQAEKLLTDQIPKVIVSDYAKLRTVGACASIEAVVQQNCPFDHADWQFTDDAQHKAAAVLRKSSEISSYGAMLPGKYVTYTLPWSQNKTANDRFGGAAFDFIRCYRPFHKSPASAQLAKPITPPGPGATYEISTLGFLTGSGVVGDVYDMNPPPASITDHLFGDGESDLNADQESFFRDFLSPSRTLEGFPYKDVKPQWWKNTDCTN